MNQHKTQTYTERMSATEERPPRRADSLQPENPFSEDQAKDDEELGSDSFPRELREQIEKKSVIFPY